MRNSFKPCGLARAKSCHVIAITPDGNTALVANEGEPNGDYSVDPEGSVTLIDISGGAGSGTACIALQENNAIAVIDVNAREISAVLGLCFKDHGLIGNELDASNRDDSINIREWPLLGVYMPDTIDSYEFNGITYLVTPNKGDGRE